MAIRKVARLGHPVLRQPTRELTVDEIRSPKMRALVRDMVETMYEYGGVGLAAPQVHESVRLAVLQVDDDSERYPDQEGQQLIVLFNAKVTPLDERTFGFWEGCLSVPDMRGYVERPCKVRIDYLDHEGEARSIEAVDFLATVFQHEIDHLDGVLYVDRLADPLRFAFVDEYQRYHLEPHDDPE